MSTNMYCSKCVKVWENLKSCGNLYKPDVCVSTEVSNNVTNRIEKKDLYFYETVFYF